MNVYDTSMKSYKIAVESFNEIAMDQKPSDRLTYRNVAMEAISGPDSGMVLDRLYKSVMGRASINFGKIPESMGDLTKFFKYKSLAESLTLLHRNLDEYNIKELALTQELHDTIIRCHEDFSYGFKVDSQFLKTTYNTMVYSLCEMINLCDVIYIDMLKAGAEGRPFTYEGYGDLILVQNVQKFVDMVKSGEWSRMTTGIKKDARNLLDVVFGGNDDSPASAISQLKAPVGILGLWAAASTPGAKAVARDRAWAAAGGAGKYSDTAYKAASKTVKDAFKNANRVSFKDMGTAMGNLVGKVWNTIPGKIMVVILGIIAVLFILRSIVMLWYKGKYALRDVLDDNEKFLKFHMEHNTDPSGTSKSMEKQKAMYDMLSSLRDKISRGIMDSDAQARKDLKQSNAEDFSPAIYQSSDRTSDSADAGFAIG